MISSTSIAAGWVGQIGALLLVLGIFVALTWSWLVGGVICLLAILLVGNNAWRHAATTRLAKGIRTTRQPK